MAKTLIILATCIGPGGKVLEKGEKPTIQEDQHIYDLIASGRALDLSTKEGKEKAEEIGIEVELENESKVEEAQRKKAEAAEAKAKAAAAAKK